MAHHVMAFVQGFGDFDEARGVYFKDSLGIGVVAYGRRISCEGENVMDSQGVGAQQFRLQADDISVPAGEVENGFHLIAALDDGGKGNGAHAHFSHRAVRNVYGVHIGGDFDYLRFCDRGRGTFGRVQFRSDGKYMLIMFFF